ncbi:unnamed protein product [Amoebophrya sp. A120]|nr:unnamed protein product [Amoebophrya sp. A120]|eukprot:GSA120T00007122001.1
MPGGLLTSALQELLDQKELWSSWSDTASSSAGTRRPLSSPTTSARIFAQPGTPMLKINKNKFSTTKNLVTHFFFGPEEDPNDPGPPPNATGEEQTLCPADGKACPIGCPTRACVEGQYCPQDDHSFKADLKVCPKTGCPKEGCVKNALERKPYQLRPCSRTGRDRNGQAYQNFGRQGRFCDDPKHPNNNICVTFLPNDFCKWSVALKPGGMRVGYSEKTAADGGKFYTYDLDRSQEFYTEMPRNQAITSAKNEEDEHSIWERSNTVTGGKFLNAAQTRWPSTTTDVRTQQSGAIAAATSFAYSVHDAVTSDHQIDPNYQKNETCCRTEDNFCREVEGEPMCVTLEQFRNYMQSGQNLLIKCSASRDHLNTGCWWNNDLAWNFFGGKQQEVPGVVSVDTVTPPISGSQLR